MILSFETAVSGGSIALLEPTGDVVGSWTGAADDILKAETILERIDRVLRDSACTSGQITRITTSAGPGSFTGIRVGIATALGLKAGLDAAVAIVPALQAIANAYPDADLAALPMGRGYAALQSFSSGDPTSPARSLSISQLPDVIGDRVAVVHADLLADLPHIPNIVDAGANTALLLGRYSLRSVARIHDPIFLSKPQSYELIPQ